MIAVSARCRPVRSLRSPPGCAVARLVRADGWARRRVSSASGSVKDRLDPGWRPRCGGGRGPSASRQAGSTCREHVLASNRRSFGPFPKCLIERVFEQGQSYTTALTSRQVARAVGKNSSLGAVACRGGSKGGSSPLASTSTISVAPAHRKHLERGGHRHAEPRAARRAPPSRNSCGSKFSQPSPSM